MKINTVEFVKSAEKKDHYPDYKHPEFAFIGKSNVGKSSLINMVVNKKTLMRTGAKPGVTITINFILMNKCFSIADLPGFGFAKISGETKKKLQPMIYEYFRNRKNLKLVFFLIDIRRTPDDAEKEIISFLAEHKIWTAIVATKADKLTRNELNKAINSLSENLDIPVDSIFVSSATKRTGRDEILKLMQEYSSE